MIDSCVVTVCGYRLHYLAAGNGPPVMLLHGFVGSAEEWRPTLAALAGQGYRAIAVDALGFGRSDKPGDAPYSLSLYADLYAGLLDTLDLGSAAFIAHSMGGKFALATAILHPTRMTRLVLADTDGFAPASPLTKAGDWPLLGPALLWISAQTMVVRAFLRAAFARPEAFVTPELIERSRNALSGPDNRRALQGLCRHYDAIDLQRSGLRARLNEIRCPTLIVWGSQDRVFSSDYSAVVQQEIAGSQLVLLPDCGHFPHIEAADDFQKIVTAFLADGDTSAGGGAGPQAPAQPLFRPVGSASTPQRAETQRLPEGQRPSGPPHRNGYDQRNYYYNETSPGLKGVEKGH